MTLRCSFQHTDELVGDEQLIAELAEVSRVLVGDGLITAFEPSFLKECFRLRDSFLISCRKEDTLAGYALIQRTLDDPPPWMQPISAKLAKFTGIGYANFIVALKNFRGKGGIYDVISEATDVHPQTCSITFITFARPDNPRAMHAHEKRGWISTGYFEDFELAGQRRPFELLARGPKATEISSFLASQKYGRSN